MARAKVLTWDWKEQPDLRELGRIITDLSDGGVHLHQVDTGSDEYAIVVSDQPLAKDDVQATYRARWDDDA